MSGNLRKKRDFSHIISQTADKAYGRLKEMGIPPYPKYYQEIFMDIINSYEDPDLISYVNKYNFLFEIDRINRSVADEYYHLAHKSIDEFSNTHENIKVISQSKSIDLNEISREDKNIDKNKLLSLVLDFQKNLEDELERSSNVIENLKNKIELLERESNIDPLTKAFNKRALLKDLGEILRFGKEKDLDLYLLAVDIDDFTYTNQTYGYIAGDKILIYLSKLLTNTLRRGVRVYRYEGECFVVVLNRVDKEDASFVAKRILHDTRESNLYYKGNNIKLTVSIGMTKHQKNDDFNVIIQRAFDALKIAKEKGKNTIVEG